MSPTDEHDLELVSHVRPEPTPDDATVAHHRTQLQTAIRAATNGSPAAASDPAAAEAGDDGPLVVSLTGRRAARGRAGGRHRIVVAVAAAVVVLGGVFAAVQLGAEDDRTVTGSENQAAPDGAAQPGSPTEPPCGTELPFDFPTLPGYEGPFEGPSGRLTGGESAMWPGTLQLHWRSAEATIDVEWPGVPPIDPTTAWDGEPTHVSENLDGIYWTPVDGADRVRSARFRTGAIGAVQCAEIGVNVTAGDPGVVDRTLDQIQVALVGPGGVLPSPAQGELVVESSEAEALPEVTPCQGLIPYHGGPVDDAGTYATPEEALASFLVTEPLMQWAYEEIALPDGSRGYVFDQVAFATGPYGDEIPDPTGPVTDSPVTIVHVAPRDGGWSVDYWRASAC